MAGTVNLGTVVAYCRLDASGLIGGISTARAQLTGLSQEGTKMGSQFEKLLPTMLKYRALSTVFGEIGKSISAVTMGVMDLEKQTSRVQRILPGLTRGVIGQDIIQESARLGTSIQQSGEAFYQMGTFIKTNSELLTAVKNSMNLVVGMEGDVRDTTRAVVQTFFQFNNQLGKGISQSEGLRRAGELIAVTWKDAHAEVGEITNALKYFGPVAEAAKVKADETFAVIGGLATLGQRGRMGGTGPGQFLAQLVKNYNTEIGGIEKNGIQAIFPLARNDEGGIALIRTLEGIVSIAKKLPTAEATKFLSVISGTQQSFRFLGDLEEILPRIKANYENTTKAAAGLTREGDKFAKIMTDNLPGQMQQAWQGALDIMATKFAAFANAINLKGFFRGLHEQAVLGLALESEAEANRKTYEQSAGGQRGKFDYELLTFARARLKEGDYYYGRNLRPDQLDTIRRLTKEPSGPVNLPAIEAAILEAASRSRAPMFGDQFGANKRGSIGGSANLFIRQLLPKMGPALPGFNPKGGLRTKPEDDEKAQHEAQKVAEDARREAEAIRSSAREMAAAFAELNNNRFGAQRIRFQEEYARTLREQPANAKAAGELYAAQLRKNHKEEQQALAEIVNDRRRKGQELLDSFQGVANGIAGGVPTVQGIQRQLRGQAFTASMKRLFSAQGIFEQRQINEDFFKGQAEAPMLSQLDKAGAGLGTFAEEVDKLAAREDRIARFGMESGQTSKQVYLAGLQDRLKGYEQYSDEWFRISNEIMQVQREINSEAAKAARADDRLWKGTFHFLPDLFGELGHEAGGLFGKGLEKALGGNIFGKALSKALQRQVDDLMDNLIQSIFRKKAATGGAGGGGGGGLFGFLGDALGLAGLFGGGAAAGGAAAGASAGFGIGDLFGALPFAFDNPTNDRKAFRWGSDFGKFFGSGAVAGMKAIPATRIGGNTSVTHNFNVSFPGTIVRSDSDIQAIASAVSWELRNRLRVVPARG